MATDMHKYWFSESVSCSQKHLFCFGCQ